MRLIYNMEDFTETGCVAALGTFDGVHLGHERLLKECVCLARQEGVLAVALTFDRHPLTLVSPETAPFILTNAQTKRELIAQTGVDVLVEQPFTREFSTLTPENFFDRLYAALHPRALVVGFNYSFGWQGKGNAQLLRKLCMEAGVCLRVMEPVCVEGEPVSSSRVRALIQEGDLEKAALLLGRTWSWAEKT